MKELFRLLERLFERTGDLILKTFTGVIIFVPLDGILGLIFSKFANPDNSANAEKIVPFFLTQKIFSLFNDLYATTKSYYFSILVFYLLLFAWGKLIYILRQVFILDKVKFDYTEWIPNSSLDERDVKLYVNLRKKVWKKLKNENFSSEIKKFLEENGDQKNNDYLLYLLLGRVYYSSEIRKRALDSDEIAFIGSNFLSIASIIVISYIFLSIEVASNNFIYNLSSLLFLLGLYLVFFNIIGTSFLLLKKFMGKKIHITFRHMINDVLFGLFVVSPVVTWFSSRNESLVILNIIFFVTLTFLITIKIGFIQAVAKRYMARNKRIYINYLMDKEGIACKIDLLNKKDKEKIIQEIEKLKK
jgi:hypothetical protein